MYKSISNNKSTDRMQYISSENIYSISSMHIHQKVTCTTIFAAFPKYIVYLPSTLSSINQLAYTTEQMYNIFLRLGNHRIQRYVHLQWNIGIVKRQRRPSLKQSNLSFLLLHSSQSTLSSRKNRKWWSSRMRSWWEE